MAVDMFLRDFGFAIHARPKDAGPTWRDKRTGKVVSEAEATARALWREREKKAKAK